MSLPLAEMKAFAPVWKQRIKCLSPEIALMYSALTVFSYQDTLSSYSLLFSVEQIMPRL